MPRGIPNKKVEEIGEVPQGTGHEPVEKEDLVSVVSKMLAETEEKLLRVMSTLNNRLELLEKQPAKQEVKVEQTMGAVKSDDKCPDDIRKLVSDKISPKCSVRVEDSKTAPTFTVHITLPVELQSQENDIRSKTVSYSEGINGISEWLDKVKKNIWETFKSRGESVPNVK